MSLSKPQQFEMEGITFKYNPKSKWVNFKAGTQKGRIKQKDLWMMTFMITKDKKQQDDLITEQDREMMQFVRQHQIKCTRDMKEGEMITVNCNVNVPVIVVESLLKSKGIEDPKTVMLSTKDLSTPTEVVDEKEKVL